jgi:hypothetical protein
MACGGSPRSSSLLRDGDDNLQAWCTNRLGAKCGGDRLLAQATYAEVRTIVGCEALPVEAPLCPIGNCDPTCLCRESLLKRLENLLLGDKGGGQEFEMKDEL